MSAPLKKYSLGRVNAAVWENDFQGEKSYSFSFQVSYKNKAGQWENKQFFTPSDLPALAELCHFLTGKSLTNKTGKTEQEPEPVSRPEKGYDNDIPF